MAGKFRLTRGRLVVGIFGVVLAILFVSLLFTGGTNQPAYTVDLVKPVDSTEMKATVIIPTLQSDVPQNTNIVWCASFLCAWKALVKDLAQGSVSLEGAPGVLSALQNADDPRAFIPEEALCLVTGWNHLGVQDRIKAELLNRFPAKAPPVFPGILPKSPVAYAYLEVNVKFRLPYLQNDEPLVFSDRQGCRTSVSSFGIRAHDGNAYLELRRQPRVLYEETEEPGRAIECIIDLDRDSQPNQIIVAMLPADQNLAGRVTEIEEKIAAAHAETDDEQTDDGDLGSNDVLLVPDISCSVSHQFKELEKCRFPGGPIESTATFVAEQDIQFRLDRSGATLKSEAKHFYRSSPTAYVFDRPFLVSVKKRGAKAPFFVLWVDNAELLRKW